jgi:hypothetical protein
MKTLASGVRTWIARIFAHVGPVLAIASIVRVQQTSVCRWALT